MNKTKQNINYPEVVCRAINTLRTKVFEETEFFEISHLPKTKARIILNTLRKFNIIYIDADKKYRVCNPSLPIYISQFNIPVQSALDKYYSYLNYISNWQKKNGKKGRINEYGEIIRESKINDKTTTELTEEECIKFLQSTGKYKILLKIEDWKEI